MVPTRKNASDFIANPHKWKLPTSDRHGLRQTQEPLLTRQVAGSMNLAIETVFYPQHRFHLHKGFSWMKRRTEFRICPLESTFSCLLLPTPAGQKH